MYLMQNGREFYNQQFQQNFNRITRLSDETVRLYERSENGSNYEYVQQSLPELKNNYANLYGGLQRYREDYLSQTMNPDGNFLQMLKSLEQDCLEDMRVLDNLNHQPGQSMVESVYAAQLQADQAPLQQEPELPGEDMLYGQNYPGENTLYGSNTQNYPGGNAVPGQDGGMNLQGTAMNYPGPNTVNLQAELHAGRLGQVIQPFRPSSSTETIPSTRTRWTFRPRRRCRTRFSGTSRRIPNICRSGRTGLLAPRCLSRLLSITARLPMR